MALLILAVAAACRVTAFHVDHGLRAAGRAESELVSRTAARLGAGFVGRRAEIEPGPNLEARARAARRALMPRDVATGHTMDDQVETVLLNLLRGAAADGLSGMRVGPRHPLLGIRRAETLELCRESGVEWVEDPMNDDPRFLRNRIRHELVPLMNDLAGRDVVPVIARQAGLMAQDCDELDACALREVPDVADARRLAEVSIPLARRAVRQWLRLSAPATDDASDGHPPSSADVERVLAVARGQRRATELPRQRRVGRSRGRLSISESAADR
jgi:tRNA(Ile)-lysidine synthase